MSNKSCPNAASKGKFDDMKIHQKPLSWIFLVIIFASWNVLSAADQVSYTDILLQPAKYLNKTVTMKGGFSYKNNERKSFTIKQGDDSVEIVYEKLSQKEKEAILAEKNFSWSPVVATGVLMRYSDAENTFYVEAENVAFVAEGDSTSKTTKEQTPESSPSLKSPVNLREVQLNQEKYIDKEISVEGILSLSTYFNYGYSDLNGNVRQTHYAFRLEANETEANLYWRKSEAESVKDALVAAEKQGVKSLSAKVVFVIRKDRYEQTDDIYAEIVRAEAIRPGSTAEDYQPFFDAAKHGDFGSIRRFLSAPSSSLSLRSDVNAIDNDGKTALMLAIEASHDSVVRTLLAHGANPTIKAKNGQTAAELAAAGNHAATIALVRTALSLRGKAPTRPLVNLREVQLNQGKYIDKEVTAKGNISLSTYFNYGYSDNESNARKTHYSFRLKSDDVEANLYWTKSAAQVVNNALIKAEAQGLKDIPASVTFMIRKDRYQPTDDIFAEVIGIDLYSESSAGVEDNLNAQLYRAFDYEGQLFAACKDGNRAAVNEAIAKGAVVDACTDDGNTALMAAAANGHADIIKDLITAHASVNKITPDGNTPLMLAAWEGKPEAIKELIAAGAKPDAKKPDGKTAMHLAVFQGHTDAVNALLESKANIDLQDSEMYTPLMVAVDKERVDIFQLLLDHGARQGITNRQGNSALHLASSIKTPAIAKLLLEKGASVNLQNIKLETPLLIAANNWNKEVVVLLLEHDADVNIQDRDGTSPANNSRLWDVAPEIAGLIKKAASNHQAKPIEVGHDNAAMTNRKSADQNLVDEMKREIKTANLNANNLQFLVHARISTEPSTLDSDLNEGADVNATDVKGNTALMLSAQRGHLEVLKFLIDKGADIDKTNKMGKTALDLAQDDQIIAAIKKAQYAKKLKQDSGVRLPKI